MYEEEFFRKSKFIKGISKIGEMKNFRFFKIPTFVKVFLFRIFEFSTSENVENVENSKAKRWDKTTFASFSPPKQEVFNILPVESVEN